MSRSLVVGALAAAVVFVAPTGALAVPVKCQQAIAKASAKYAQGRAKVLGRCEDLKAKGALSASTVCETEPTTMLLLGKLPTKLASSIAKQCGGGDKTCGTGGDDDPLASIGWAGVPFCPDFESQGCNNAINHCGDIVTCLQCVADVAVDQAVALYYASLNQAEFGSNSAVNKCQQAIGKSTVKFLRAKSKALQKCWDARMKAKHSNLCPVPGDGKAQAAIDKAETKKISSICKACGGPDKLCNGTGDLAPAQIGFAGSCPDVTPPGASSCIGAILDADDIVDCVDCVTEFKVDCLDALTVPQFVSPLPANCNPNATTTSTSTSSSSTSSSSTSSSTSTSSSSTSTSVPTTSSSSTSIPTTSSTSSSTSIPTTSSTSSSTSIPTTSSTSSSTSIPTTSSTSSSTSIPTTSSTSSSTSIPTTSSSSSSTSVPTTSSSSTSVLATTTTSSTFTTTTFAGFIDLTTLTPAGNSGNTFRQADGSGPSSLVLRAGFLYIGSGDSSVPAGATPDGGVNRFAISCAGTACTLGPMSPAGTGFECSDTNCKFGLLLPVVNAGLSTCVVNTFKQPVTGTLTNVAAGAVTLDVLLNSHTILTGDAAQPCPLCRVGAGGTGAACAGTPAAPCNGFCDRGANRTLACTSRNSTGLSNDCPPPNDVPGTQRCYGGTGDNNVCTSASTCGGGTCSQFVGDLEVDLNPLTTGLTEKSDANGIFCPAVGPDPGQDGPGAFVTGTICDSTSGANFGIICTTDANCTGGQCASRICDAGGNIGKECLFPADCPSGTCVKISELARDIRESGQTLSGSLFPAGTTRNLRLGSVFCIPLTESAPVNGAADLPGPGATSLRSTLRIVP